HDIDARGLDAARGRLDKALAAAEAQRLPVEDIWFGYARLELRSGGRRSAREACERAIAVAPNALAPLRLLGSLALDDGDFIASQAWSRRAPLHHPGETPLLQLRGPARKG